MWPKLQTLLVNHHRSSSMASGPVDQTQSWQTGVICDWRSVAL